MPQAPHVQAFFDPATFTVSYVVHDPASKAAAIIDPVLDFTPRNARTSTRSADLLLAWVAEQGLKVEWLLETHAHADHLSAAHYLREQTGAPIVIGAAITAAKRPESGRESPVPKRASTHRSARVAACKSGQCGGGPAIVGGEERGGGVVARATACAGGIDTDGPLLAGAEMGVGSYELVFFVKDYFVTHLEDSPFLDRVPVRFAVAGAGEDAAAVDACSYSVGRDVLGDEEFRTELGRAVERDGRGGGQGVGTGRR